MYLGYLFSSLLSAQGCRGVAPPFNKTITIPNPALTAVISARAAKVSSSRAAPSKETHFSKLKCDDKSEYPGIPFVIAGFKELVRVASN